MKRFLLAFLASVTGLSLFAGIDPDVSEPAVGKWCGNFPESKAFAEANGLPFVLVWGNYGCKECGKLTDALNTVDAKTWAEEQTAVFCFVEGVNGGDVDPNYGAVEFASTAGGICEDPGYYPYVCLYKEGVKAVTFSGRIGMMYSTMGSTLFDQFANSCERFFAEVATSESFAAFPFGCSGNQPGDRLEAEVGTTQFVDVPLVRTNATGEAASNQVVFEYGGKKDAKTLSWSAGETMRFVRYNLPAVIWSGTEITVSLMESDGMTVIATRSIRCVGEVENSPKNPYWLGERTANSLQWGEWTMDLGIVTNKVKSWNKAHPNDRAYAMMFVGGSTWCPDCAMAEANVFSKQEFKDWAAEHKVVFGVLDIPSNPQATEAFPSQLRYESYRTSDAYVTLRGSATADETQRYQSGAGYLSRHSVPYADALDVSARNAFLMGHDTLHGGWNRPERENKNRTGVPVLLLLRDDGTIAARWNRFSDVGPAAYSDGYLRRFEEMMVQMDDPNDESDDDKSTTTRTIASGDAVEATVSAVDQADVYRLDGFAENEVARFFVTGDAKPLKAALVDGVTGTELVSANGLASKGFTLVSKIKSPDSCFLRISPAELGDGTVFGYTNESSTVCSYSISASGGMSGGEFGFAVAATNVAEDCGIVEIAVCRVAGSNGAASVKVKLVEKSGTAVDERIEWTDATLAWADGEEGVKTATLTVKADGLVRHDMRLGFELADLWCAADDKTISQGELTVNVYDVDYFGKPILRHVAAEDVRSVADYKPGDEVKVVLKRGTLPTGLGIDVFGGQIAAVGYASADAGEYSATYAVTVTRGGVVVSTREEVFDFTVIDYDFAGDFPSLAVLRNYGNLPVEESGLIKGMLTVTIPPEGNLSAKYVIGGKAYAYAADGWAGFDKAAGTLVAVLDCTTEGVPAMTVMLASGGGIVTFDDPADGTPRAFDLPIESWPDGARAWQGQYTVQMPQTNAVDGAGVNRLGGAAYMAMRMISEEAIAEGAMLYAGVLPNGRAVYGNAILISHGQQEARLPFCHASDLPTAPFSLSGGFAIRANAATDEEYLWCVTAAWPTVWEVPDAYGHSANLNVFGGYYDRDTITACFREDLGGDLTDLAFCADTGSVVSGRYGQGSPMDPVAAEMTETNMPQLVAGVGNPQDVTLEFLPETGVIKGSFIALFDGHETMLTYRGIALPGWQNCAACSRKHFVERPWAIGSCSFSDRAEKTIAFRNGCLVRLTSYSDVNGGLSDEN